MNEDSRRLGVSITSLWTFLLLDIKNLNNFCNYSRCQYIHEMRRDRGCCLATPAPVAPCTKPFPAVVDCSVPKRQMLFAPLWCFVGLCECTTLLQPFKMAPLTSLSSELKSVVPIDDHQHLALDVTSAGFAQALRCPRPWRRLERVFGKSRIQVDDLGETVKGLNMGQNVSARRRTMSAHLNVGSPCQESSAFRSQSSPLSCTSRTRCTLATILDSTGWLYATVRRMLPPPNCRQTIPKVPKVVTTIGIVDCGTTATGLSCRLTHG